jgi:hypothetical protein
VVIVALILAEWVCQVQYPQFVQSVLGHRGGAAFRHHAFREDVMRLGEHHAGAVADSSTGRTNSSVGIRPSPLRPRTDVRS